MSSLSGYSRRAVVATTAALAVAPVVTAKKKKGKNTKKSPPPLALATVTGTERTGQGAGTLLLSGRVDYYHPDTGNAGLFQIEMELAFATLQADLTAQVREAVIRRLSQVGLSVPDGRIAVTVL